MARVLVACEFSGVVRRAFRARGHDAWSCDLLPAEDGGDHIQGDVLDVIDQGWDLMVAHPPCTRLTNSGVRWLHVPPTGKTSEEMWGELELACEFYRRLRNAPIKRKAIENPVMHKYARVRVDLIKNARQVVQPWWFGDPFFKATGLELHGLPRLRATNRLNPPSQNSVDYKAWSAVHRATPGPNRWKDRSRTFPGMAEAMADQWGGLA